MSAWRDITLGDFIALQRGHDLPTKNREEGSIPVMGSFGITGQHSVAKAKGPGVTLGRSGASIGTVAFVEEDYWPLNTCMYVTDFKGNDPKFVFHFLSTLNLAGFNSGSAQPSLNRNYIYPIDIFVPEPAEQREIAGVLGALDDKIEANRKAAACLEEMARALYRSWFVTFDPVHAKSQNRPPAHMDPTTAALFPDRFSENGLPEGWEMGTVADVCEHVKKTVKPMDSPNEPFLHFSLPAFDNDRIPVLENGEAIKSNKAFVPHDAIMFSRLNPTIPRVWWAKTNGIEATPAASTEFYVASAKKPVETPWLYCLLSSPEFRDDALSRVTGTSNSHQRVPPKVLAEVDVVKPVKETIEAFGEITGGWFDKIHSVTKENQTLATLRDTLLPRLMSGTLRVKADEAEVEAVL